MEEILSGLLSEHLTKVEAFVDSRTLSAVLRWPNRVILI